MLEQTNQVPMRVVVIIGCQRSGTTLTGQIMGAHPDSFLIDESDGLYPWFDALIGLTGDMKALHRDVIHKAAKKYRDNRRLISEFDQLETMNLILKAPNLTYRLDEIASLGYPTHIIFPVRDVRSVVASMSRLSNIPMIENQTRFLESDSVLAVRYEQELLALRDDHVAQHIKQALIWKVKTGYYKQCFRCAMNPCIFKYEDLVESPHILGANISSHCGITFSDRQTAYYNVLVGTGPGNTSRERPIDKVSMQKWANIFSLDQVNEILAVAGDTMLELGYELSEQLG